MCIICHCESHIRKSIYVSVEFTDPILNNLLQVQSVRDVDPTADCFSLGQFVHCVAPSSLYVFTEHWTHPMSDKYLPAVQGTEIFCVTWKKEQHILVFGYTTINISILDHYQNGFKSGGPDSS